MHRFNMLLHKRTEILHYCYKLQQNILQVFNLYFPISAYLEGLFSHEVFPVSSIALSNIIYFRLYLGDLWSCYEGPHFSQLGFRGSVSIFNPPLTIMSIRLYFPNLGTLIHYLGPLGLMGPPRSGTRVWGTLLEVNCHLLHVHASVWVPPRPILTFQEPLGVPTPTYSSQLVLAVVSLSQAQ